MFYSLHSLNNLRLNYFIVSHDPPEDSIFSLAALVKAWASTFSFTLISPVPQTFRGDFGLQSNPCLSNESTRLCNSCASSSALK